MNGAPTRARATGVSRPTVAVIGGGIAGLSAAWELTCAAPGTRVVILESDERLGGKLRTGAIGGRAVDLGPDAFLARRPEAVSLCREVGLGDELVSPGSRSAFVWARGRLRPLPTGLALGVPTRLGPLARSGILSWLGVGRATLDLVGWPPRRRDAAEGAPDRAVADITDQHLGHEVTDWLVDPLVGGIHAGDTASMSAAAVFPALLEAASRPGSLMRALRHPGPGDDEPPVFYTVRDGLSRLVDGLANALGSRGVEVRLRTPVEHLGLRAAHGHHQNNHPEDPERARPRWSLRTPQGNVESDAIVIAIPAKPMAALLDPVEPSVATALRTIDYANVTIVTLQFPTTDVDHPLDGTGFLVPRRTDHLITACTWLTSKWPELRRPGDVLLRASTGRFRDDRAAGMPDDELVGRVVDELGSILGVRARPTDAVVTRWTDAFPQYTVGHVDRVATIEKAVAGVPGLALAGAAFHGVGIPACIASGRQAAATVLREPVVTGHTTR
jgi:oxygen-dependent protoporphyrinogen oxidase